MFIYIIHMLCIYHQSTDPYFNVATDEYILKQIEEDCFMLWRNDNAIIVGRFQNTLSEINYDFVRDHQIAIVRRLSGGGAVYHDLGNLNYSFTQKGENTSLANFEKYTRPIIDVLQDLGTNARFEGRNDITIDGKKISGNAEHIYKNKILHHGCILFSSKMKNVSEALNINPAKYVDKAVKSVPKRVTNVSDHLTSPLTVDEFTKKIMEHVLAMDKSNRLYSFTKDDLEKIQKLRDEKYATDAWNFGESPAYSFKKSIRTKGGTLEMNLEVKKGIIEKIKIYGDFFSEKGIHEIEAALVNVHHEEKAIRQVLASFPIEKHFQNIDTGDLVEAMF